MRVVVRAVAVGLLVTGVALIGIGSSMAFEAFGCSGDCFFAGFSVVAGATLLLLGAGHVAAFVGIWRGRVWGSWLGISLAVAGLAINAFMLIAGMRLNLDGRQLTGVWFWPLAAYGLVLFAIVVDLRGGGPAGHTAPDA